MVWGPYLDKKRFVFVEDFVNYSIEPCLHKTRLLNLPQNVDQNKFVQALIIKNYEPYAEPI